MPGEFYIEGSKAKISLKAIEEALALLDDKLESVKGQTDKLAGQQPLQGSTTADWQIAESDVVVIGAAGQRLKLHDLSLGIQSLAGTQVTVRLYKQVNETERKVYEQTFDTTADPPGLPVVNGSWAVHGQLRVTLQSNDPADNGQAVDYDAMLEAM